MLILYLQDVWTADSKVQEGVWCLSASFISSSMIPSPTKFLVCVTDRLLQLLARCLRGSCMLCVLLAARDCIELRRILIRCVEKVRDAVVDSLVGQDALSFISSLIGLERYRAQHPIPNTLASHDTNTQYQYRYRK